MPKDYLPTQVDPQRLAENATTIQGHLQIQNMERLCQSLHASDGDVAVELRFGIDPGRIRFLKGEMTTTLTLQCQRCMEPFQHDVKGDFVYGIVNSDEKARQLPNRYDPIVLTQDELNIQDLIEEELIISLPIVPMHCSEDCKVHLPIVVAEDPMANVADNNPFKVIELLKVKNKSE